jgi:hypothetical protein
VSIVVKFLQLKIIEFCQKISALDRVQINIIEPIFPKNKSNVVIVVKNYKETKAMSRNQKVKCSFAIDHVQ